MVDEILRSVIKSEDDAEKVIVEAKEKALQIKNGAKEEIAAKKSSDEAAFAQESEKRRAAVKEEEERKDKEYILSVTEELDELSLKASKDEERIIAELSEKIYAI